MNNKTRILLLVVGLVGVFFIGAPFVSTMVWKSSTLEKTNSAVDAINANIEATNKFNEQNPATETSYNDFLSSLKNEQAAISTARDASKNVGGIKGIDVFGSYRKADDTSKKLTKIYDELLAYNATEVSRMEVDKLLTLSFLPDDRDFTPTMLNKQAQSIRRANEASQKYLASGQNNELEKKFSEIIARMADSFDELAEAQNSGNASRINASANNLEGIVKELESVQVEVDAKASANQQKAQSIIDRLNVVAQELI